MGNLFAGIGTALVGGILGSQTRSSTSSAPPAWVTRAGRTALTRATALSNREYTPYAGTRVSPLSESERLANRNARATGEYFSGALERSTSSWADADRSRYMNPYAEGALAPTARRRAEAGALRRNSLQSSAVSRGAFGGSRGAILEGANERDTQTGIDDIYAEGMDRAYREGQGQFNTEQDRLARAGVEAQRGLYEAGQLERGVDQANADVNYSDFLERRDWDVTNLDILLRALSGMPGMGTTQTSTGAPGAGALGGAISGFQLGSQLFPNNNGTNNSIGTGSTYNGVNTNFGSFVPVTMPGSTTGSDRRLKYDIEQIGQRGGLPLYAFKYTGTDEVRIGFMSDDVRKVIPGAVMVDENGFDRVNYRMVLEATRAH